MICLCSRSEVVRTLNLLDLTMLASCFIILPHTWKYCADAVFFLFFNYPYNQIAYLLFIKLNWSQSNCLYSILLTTAIVFAEVNYLSLSNRFFFLWHVCVRLSVREFSSRVVYLVWKRKREVQIYKSWN